MATLLLADDSPTIQRVVELIFAEKGLRVVAVSDGPQAMQALAVERPDVVLASIHLPKISGYELAEHIQRDPSLHGLPVLLLAGSFEAQDEERMRRAQVAGVVVKPFEPAVVVRRVEELIGRRAPALSPPRPVAPEAGVRPAWPRERERSEASVGRPTASEEPRMAHPPAGTAAAHEVRPAAPPERPRASAAPFVATPPLAPADAFAALLAAEEGDGAPPAAWPVDLGDEALDRLADRVAERLAERLAGEVGARAAARLAETLSGDGFRALVHDTTERLVREEIARIREAASTRSS